MKVINERFLPRIHGKPRVVIILVLAALLALPGAVLGSGYGVINVTSYLQVFSADGEIRANWTDVAAYGEGEMAVPQLYQADYTNTLAIYRGEVKSVLTSGCGTVCLSMVLAYLREDLAQSPETIFRDACLDGYYRGNGLSLATLRALAQSYGIQADYGGKYQGTIRAALSKGYPVIAYMDKGVFSDGGHYIVLRGMTPEGQVRVNDPNSHEKSGKTYDLALIVRQSRSDNPFLICKP